MTAQTLFLLCILDKSSCKLTKITQKCEIFVWFKCDKREQHALKITNSSKFLLCLPSSEIRVLSWKKKLRCPLRKDLNSIVSKCYVLVYDSVRRTFDYYLHCKCLWQLEIICKSWSLLLRFWKWFLGRFQRTLFLGLFRRFLFFIP